MPSLQAWSTTEKKSKTLVRAGLEIWAPALQPLGQPRWLLTLCLLHRTCNCMLGITKGWRNIQPKINDFLGFFSLFTTTAAAAAVLVVVVAPSKSPEILHVALIECKESSVR